jgi:hypothetical protein
MKVLGCVPRRTFRSVHMRAPSPTRARAIPNKGRRRFAVPEWSGYSRLPNCRQWPGLDERPQSTIKRMETVLFNVADGIATVTLNRPDKFNALNLQQLRVEKIRLFGPS